jgi:hypothetical protein
MTRGREPGTERKRESGVAIWQPCFLGDANLSVRIALQMTIPKDKAFRCHWRI